MVYNGRPSIHICLLLQFWPCLRFCAAPFDRLSFFGTSPRWARVVSAAWVLLVTFGILLILGPDFWVTVVILSLSRTFFLAPFSFALFFYFYSFASSAAFTTMRLEAVAAILFVAATTIAVPIYSKIPVVDNAVAVSNTQNGDQPDPTVFLDPVKPEAQNPPGV